MPNKLKDEIAGYSRLDRIDLSALMKLKTAKAIENISMKQGAVLSQIPPPLTPRPKTAND